MDTSVGITVPTILLYNMVPSFVQTCAADNLIKPKVGGHNKDHRVTKQAKPRVSLTAPNCNHFVQVLLMVLDIFLDEIAKAKKLIHG